MLLRRPLKAWTFNDAKVRRLTRRGGVDPPRLLSFCSDVTQPYTAALSPSYDPHARVWWGLAHAQGEAEGPLPPLSVGVETLPVGVAYVFQSAMPDLFVVNNKLSTEPGLYLYEWLRTVRDDRSLEHPSELLLKALYPAQELVRRIYR